MTTSLGRITARLAEPEEQPSPELVNLINQNIKPPTEVTAADVYVRTMYIVSDQVNSFGGRFPADEHEHLAQLLIDSPVLVGHRKDKLPVGRSFHALSAQRNGAPWVKSYFYWLRTSDNAEQLLDNIDGGIYKECSVAFTFNLPECSICGKDIRRCAHEPFEKYDLNGEHQTCHFNYRLLEQVLETSLVYRGAVPRTSVSKDLTAGTGEDQSSGVDPALPVPVALNTLDQLDPGQQYVVVPQYDGLPLMARLQDGELLLAHPDGSPVARHARGTYQPGGFRPAESIFGMLVGYRGRERCSKHQLEKYLVDQSGPVSRLVFNVYPHQGLLTLARPAAKSKLDVRLIPNRITSVTQLERTACEIMTGAGVEIWALPSSGSYLETEVRFSYKPSGKIIPRSQAESITLIQNGNTAVLTLATPPGSRDSADATEQTFELFGMDLARLRRGRRFVARRSAGSVLKSGGRAVGGCLTALTETDGALLFRSEGELAGRYVLRPIRLAGQDCFLFYALADQSPIVSGQAVKR